jgi:hypothetical protein
MAVMYLVGCILALVLASTSAAEVSKHHITMATDMQLRNKSNNCHLYSAAKQVNNLPSNLRYIDVQKYVSHIFDVSQKK